MVEREQNTTEMSSIQVPCLSSLLVLTSFALLLSQRTIGKEQSDEEVLSMLLKGYDAATRPGAFTQKVDKIGLYVGLTHIEDLVSGILVLVSRGFFHSTR